MAAKGWDFSQMGFLDVLKTMGLFTLQLMLMFLVKALVYIGLVKLFKCIKARYFPDKAMNEETEKDKHLFDYESDWVDSEGEVESKLNKSEQEERTYTSRPPKERETIDDRKNNNLYDFPDEEIGSKLDELVSELRGRKTYKPMTKADFEKMKLEITTKNSLSKGKKAQEPHHFKKS